MSEQASERARGERACSWQASMYMCVACVMTERERAHVRDVCGD